MTVCWPCPLRDVSRGLLAAQPTSGVGEWTVSCVSCLENIGAALATTLALIAEADLSGGDENAMITQETFLSRMRSALAFCAAGVVRSEIGAMPQRK